MDISHSIIDDWMREHFLRNDLVPNVLPENLNTQDWIMSMMITTLNIVKEDHMLPKLPLVFKILQEVVEKISTQDLRCKILKCLISLKLKMTLKTLSSIKNNEQSDVDEMENEKIDSLLAFDEDFLNKLTAPENESLKLHISELKTWVKQNRSKLCFYNEFQGAKRACIDEFEEVVAETKKFLGKSFVEKLASKVIAEDKRQKRITRSRHTAKPTDTITPEDFNEILSPQPNITVTPEVHNEISSPQCNLKRQHVVDEGAPVSLRKKAKKSIFESCTTGSLTDSCTNSLSSDRQTSKRPKSRAIRLSSGNDNSGKDKKPEKSNNGSKTSYLSVGDDSLATRSTDSSISTSRYPKSRTTRLSDNRSYCRREAQSERSNNVRKMSNLSKGDDSSAMRSSNSSISISEHPKSPTITLRDESDSCGSEKQPERSYSFEKTSCLSEEDSNSATKSSYSSFSPVGLFYKSSRTVSRLARKSSCTKSCATKSSTRKEVVDSRKISVDSSHSSTTNVEFSDMIKSSSSENLHFDSNPSENQYFASGESSSLSAKDRDELKGQSADKLTHGSSLLVKKPKIPRHSQSSASKTTDSCLTSGESNSWTAKDLKKLAIKASHGRLSVETSQPEEAKSSKAEDCLVPQDAFCVTKKQLDLMGVHRSDSTIENHPQPSNKDGKDNKAMQGSQHPGLLDVETSARPSSSISGTSIGKYQIDERKLRRREEKSSRLSKKDPQRRQKDVSRRGDVTNRQHQDVSNESEVSLAEQAVNKNLKRPVAKTNSNHRSVKKSCKHTSSKRSRPERNESGQFRKSSKKVIHAQKIEHAEKDTAVEASPGLDESFKGQTRKLVSSQSKQDESAGESLVQQASAKRKRRVVLRSNLSRGSRRVRRLKERKLQRQSWPKDIKECSLKEGGNQGEVVLIGNHLKEAVSCELRERKQSKVETVDSCKKEAEYSEAMEEKPTKVSAIDNCLQETRFCNPSEEKLSKVSGVDNHPKETVSYKLRERKQSKVEIVDNRLKETKSCNSREEKPREELAVDKRVESCNLKEKKPSKLEIIYSRLKETKSCNSREEKPALLSKDINVDDSSCSVRKQSDPDIFDLHLEKSSDRIASQTSHTGIDVRPVLMSKTPPSTPEIHDTQRSSSETVFSSPVLFSSTPKRHSDSDKRYQTEASDLEKRGGFTKALSRSIERMSVSKVSNSSSHSSELSESLLTASKKSMSFTAGSQSVKKSRFIQRINDGIKKIENAIISSFRYSFSSSSEIANSKHDVSSSESNAKKTPDDFSESAARVTTSSGDPSVATPETFIRTCDDETAITPKLISCSPGQTMKSGNFNSSTPEMKTRNTDFSISETPESSSVSTPNASTPNALLTPEAFCVSPAGIIDAENDFNAITSIASRNSSVLKAKSTEMREDFHNSISRDRAMFGRFYISPITTRRTATNRSKSSTKRRISREFARGSTPKRRKSESIRNAKSRASEIQGEADNSQVYLRSRRSHSSSASGRRATTTYLSESPISHIKTARRSTRLENQPVRNQCFDKHHNTDMGNQETCLQVPPALNTGEDHKEAIVVSSNTDMDDSIWTNFSSDESYTEDPFTGSPTIRSDHHNISMNRSLTQACDESSQGITLRLSICSSSSSDFEVTNSEDS